MDTTQAAGPQVPQQIIAAILAYGDARADYEAGGKFVTAIHLGEAIKLIRAALAAQAVPAGYRLVPEEPTHKMLEAGKMAHWQQWGDNSASAQNPFRCAWSAMLVASLAPAEAKEEPDDWQHLRQFGYAPGNYMSRCRRCGQTPIMDKRAVTCRPCAEFLHAAATPQPQAAQPVAYIEHSIDTESGREETDLVWGKDDDLEGGLYEYTPLYTAAPALTEEQEREAFEEWAKTFRDLECDKGLVNLRYLGLHKTYVDYDVHRAWVVWQARAALRSTQGGE